LLDTGALLLGPSLPGALLTTGALLPWPSLPGTVLAAGAVLVIGALIASGALLPGPGASLLPCAWLPRAGASLLPGASLPEGFLPEVLLPSAPSGRFDRVGPLRQKRKSAYGFAATAGGGPLSADSWSTREWASGWGGRWSGWLVWCDIIGSVRSFFRRRVPFLVTPAAYTYGSRSARRCLSRSHQSI
jgi:hypothetical protein